jgi:hypothetical protein
MRSIIKINIDKKYQLSGYHLFEVCILGLQGAYQLAFSETDKVKISLFYSE